MSADGTAPTEAARAGETRALFAGAYRVLPGLYAWAVTVMVPAAARGAPAAARVGAVLALIALVAGPILVVTRPVLGRSIGIYGFVGCSLASWFALDGLLGIGRLDPVRAALGGVGWALFAIGWGRMRDERRVPEEDPRAVTAEPLAAKSTLPRWAGAIFGTALCLSALPPLLAWRVGRPEHALLAHVAAVGAAIALATVGARLAVGRGGWVPPSPRTRLAAATAPLVLLVLLLLLGLVMLLFGW